MADAKGLPVRIWDTPQAANALGDRAVDVRPYNAIHVQVWVTGTTPSATISIEGAAAEGGNYLALPDPNASQAAVAADVAFDVIVGAPWVKVRIASISGTFGAGRGYTVVVTPFFSPGQTQINVTNTASQNLAQYGGTAVGAGNAVHVQPGTAAAFDVNDVELQAVAGTTAGAAVTTNANGTLQQYLRGLVTLIAAKIGITIADGDSATLGATTGAAVTTNANGTVQQYLRGLVTLVAAKIGVTIADGDSATLGATTGAAITTDVDGTVQRYLRGLVKILGGVWNSTTTRLRVEVNGTRNAGVLHRDAITAVDKLAVPATVTSLSDVTTGGSLAFNTTYRVTAAAYNRWGATTVPAVATQLTANDAANTHVIQFTLAQVAGADGYDIFLSTDTNPLWVARITEAQRASADGVIITAVGTVTAGSALGAGVIQCRVVGTGVASNGNPFANNNAYTPATPAAIDCAGRNKAKVLVKVAVTDLRSLPTLSLVPFFANQVSAADWHQGELQAIPLLTAEGQTLEHEYAMDVDGETGFKLLVAAISGQGTAASVWVELA